MSRRTPQGVLRAARRPRAAAAVIGALALPLVAASSADAQDTIAATIASASGAATPAGAVISPDGSRVYVLGPGVGIVSVIDTTTNTVTATISQPNNSFGLALSPDGTRLYMTDTAADAVIVVDTTTNTILPPSIPVGDNPNGIAVSPDGTRLYVINTNAPAGGTAVSVVDTATNTVIATIAAAGVPRAVVVSPDGSRVYVSHGSPTSFNVSVIDTATNTVVDSIPMGSAANQIRSLAFSADGTTLYGVRTNADAVAVIDPATNTVVGTIAVGDNPAALAITADGSRIYVTNTNSDTVSVISTALIGTPDDPVIDTIAGGDDPRSLVITPDDLFAYVANTADQTVSVIALDTFPAIVTTTVPGATVAESYDAHLDVAGTPTPAFDAVPSAGSLPPGLTVSPAGDLSGTPTTAGTYTFTLVARSVVSGGIPASADQEFTIAVAPVAASAPLTLTAQRAGTAIELAWVAPASDGGVPVSGYRIERRAGDGAFAELVADTGSPATSFTDIDVQPGTTYSYRVYALNPGGQSPASNEASAALPPPATTTTTTATTTTTTTTTMPTSTTTTSSTLPVPTVPTTTGPATTVAAPIVTPSPPTLAPVLPETGAHAQALRAAAAAILLGNVLLVVVRVRRSA